MDVVFHRALSLPCCTYGYQDRSVLYSRLKVSLSSGFLPQSNGQTERVNQEMETMLRCMVPNVGSGPGRPSPLSGTVLRLARPMPHRGPRLSGESEGVAFHPGPSATRGVQEIGPPVYRTLPHPEGHKPGGGPAPAPTLYAHPPHLPCLQGQTCPG